MRRICVFCGSADGVRPAYAEAARALGAHLAERNIGLVYGGGRVGLMGQIADATLKAGGTVVGVIPKALLAREIGHEHLTQMHVVGSMHERKARMAELSDAFVALPGGLGTLEELCEVLTWTQLGIHSKACGILNVERYYDPLLALLDHALREGFVRPEHRAIVIDEIDPVRLIERLERGRPRPSASDGLGLEQS